MVEKLSSFLVLLFVSFGAFATAEYVAWGYKDPNGFTWFSSFISRVSDAFSGVDFQQAQGFSAVLGRCSSSASPCRVSARC
jgi:hypothetical protein